MGTQWGNRRIRGLHKGAALAVAALLIPSAGALAPVRPTTHPDTEHEHPRRPVDLSAALAAIDHAITSATGKPHPGEHDDGRGLLEHLRAARRDVLRGAECDAVAELEHTRHGVGSDTKHGDDRADVRVVPRSTDAPLDAAIITAEALVLSLPGTAKCGGSETPPTKDNEPVVVVTSSDNHHVTLHVAFPAPTFAAKQGNGEPFLELIEPGAGNGGQGAIGQPELPFDGSTIAIPIGASTRVSVLGSSSYHLSSIHLWPTQKSGAAATGGPPPQVPSGLPSSAPPFTIDRQAYASDSTMPASLAGAGAIRPMRGLLLSTLSMAGAQYVPSTGDLTVLTSLDVRVDFTGNNTGFFGTADMTGPWNVPFQNLYQSVVSNWPAAAKYVSSSQFAPALCGEEMMVITNTSLQLYAQQFADTRTKAGVWSKVFITDGPHGIGVTPTAIRDAIAAQYNSQCWSRPTYVTLFGDTSIVPTFELSLGYDSHGNPLFYEDPIATDMPYGFIHQAADVDSGALTDLNPDLFVGRIPAANAGQAFAEPKMITSYENTPPNAPNFYATVTGTALFQPCPAVQSNCHDSHGNAVAPSTQDLTSFFRSSEQVGQEAMVAAKTFQRVTSDEADNDPSATINPLTFDNGAPIPGGIDFNGSTADITNAVNAGTFLLWHSDHGYTNGGGWYEPAFGWNDIPGLTNGDLTPVVWSSDCDSGKFDKPSAAMFPHVSPTPYVSYSEYWLEWSKGVASVGASRESPIYNDGFMLQGMGASLFPEEGNVFLALFGIAPKDPVIQLAPLTVAAKIYMAERTTADLATDIGATGTYLEYNDFGDPSMALRRDAPRFIDLSVANARIANGALELSTNQAVANGAIVSLMQGGNVIGRATVSNGRVTLTPDVPLTDTTGLSVVLSGDKIVSAVIPLGQVPSPPSVTGLNPPTGTGGDPATGLAGTAVTISGSGFTGATAVDFGATSASFIVDSDTQITAIAPPGSGIVDVVVMTPNGTSATNAADQFAYQ